MADTACFGKRVGYNGGGAHPIGWGLQAGFYLHRDGRKAAVRAYRIGFRVLAPAQPRPPALRFPQRR